MNFIDKECEDMLIEEKFTSIIIAAHNHLEDTKKCITSIWRNTEECRYEIIVVDNASMDGTTNWLAEQSDIKTIHNEKNMGFSKACNQGFELAIGNEIVLLHNDVILSKSWLSRLRTVLYKNSNIAAVGPIVYNSDWYQNSDLEIKYGSLEEMESLAGKIAKQKNNRSKHVMILEDFCLLIKREAVDQIGPFDEQFLPRYYEDADYSMRLIKAGYFLAIAENVLVHHMHGLTMKEFGGERVKIHNKNLKNFELKWGFSPRYSCGVREELLELMDFNKENLTVLDIGCACGGNLMRIQEKNLQADLYGVELNANAAKFAAAFGNVENHNIEEPLEFTWHVKFDYIIMADLVEHLYDPLKTIKNLTPFLKDGGSILISIPNVMHITVIADLLNGHWEYQDAGIMDKTHIRFFTKNSILDMIEKAGLNLKYINYTTVGIEKNLRELQEQLEELHGNKNEKLFDAYQWLVVAQKNSFGLEKENIIQFLNRKANSDEEHLDDNKIIQMFSANTIDPNAIIDMMIKRENFAREIIILTAFLYQNQIQDMALRLLCIAYEKRKNDIQVVYAFAFFLHLYGDDIGARKVIDAAPQLTTDLENLLREMDGTQDDK
jgi:GT2 family glycosyltransferase/cyclopropane fatty-acyl-phospholipid synthase-like methyltransferase